MAIVHLAKRQLEVALLSKAAAGVGVLSYVTILAEAHSAAAPAWSSTVMLPRG